MDKDINRKNKIDKTLLSDTMDYEDYSNNIVILSEDEKKELGILEENHSCKEGCCNNNCMSECRSNLNKPCNNPKSNCCKTKFGKCGSCDK